MAARRAENLMPLLHLYLALLSILRRPWLFIYLFIVEY